MAIPSNTLNHYELIGQLDGLERKHGPSLVRAGEGRGDLARRILGDDCLYHSVRATDTHEHAHEKHDQVERPLSFSY